MTNTIRLRLVSVFSAIVMMVSALVLVLPSTAEAATYTTISVSFGDWRCSSTGGGKVVAVQMGSQYGSAPYTPGRTIKIKAKLHASNNLTGVVWCKKWWQWWSTPVYNIHQGVWPYYSGQRFYV